MNNRNYGALVFTLWRVVDVGPDKQLARFEFYRSNVLCNFFDNETFCDKKGIRVLGLNESSCDDVKGLFWF